MRNNFFFQYHFVCQIHSIKMKIQIILSSSIFCLLFSLDQQQNISHTSLLPPHITSCFLAAPHLPTPQQCSFICIAVLLKGSYLSADENKKCTNLEEIWDILSYVKIEKYKASFINSWVMRPFHTTHYSEVETFFSSVFYTDCLVYQNDKYVKIMLIFLSMYVWSSPGSSLYKSAICLRK